MKKEDFTVKISKDTVFAMIDCFPDSPIYEDVEEEYEQLLKTACTYMQPRAVLEYGMITEEIANNEAPENAEALFVISTVGRKISEWSTELFATGNYLAGLIVDAMADSCLFEMDHQLRPAIMQMCKQKKAGVSRRMEAPQDIPMKAQKIAYDVTNAKEVLQIGIKESYMYDPVKTVNQIYILDDKEESYKLEHDCSKCTRLDCKLRNKIYKTEDMK